MKLNLQKAIPSWFWPSRSGDVRVPELEIGSYNVRSFGKSFLDQAYKMEIVAQIMCRYDVISIQEIRDITENVSKTLLDLVNSEDTRKLCPGKQYAMSLSSKLGPESSAEQILFLYNVNTVALNECYAPVSKLFDRVPYICHFRSVENPKFHFTYIAVHLTPKKPIVQLEMDALYNVYRSVERRFKDSSAIFVMGDTNCDREQIGKAEMATLNFANNEYTWLIPGFAGTMASATDKNDRGPAFDRIIMNKRYLESVVPGSASIWEFAWGKDQVCFNINDGPTIPGRSKGMKLCSKSYDKKDRKHSIQLPENTAQMSISDHLPISMRLGGLPRVPVLATVPVTYTNDFWDRAFTAMGLDPEPRFLESDESHAKKQRKKASQTDDDMLDDGDSNLIPKVSRGRKTSVDPADTKPSARRQKKVVSDLMTIEDGQQKIVRKAKKAKQETEIKITEHVPTSRSAWSSWWSDRDNVQSREDELHFAASTSPDKNVPKTVKKPRKTAKPKKVVNDEDLMDIDEEEVKPRRNVKAKPKRRSNEVEDAWIASEDDFDEDNF